METRSQTKNFQFQFFQTYHFMRNFNLKQINLKTSDTSIISGVNPKYN